MAGSDSDWDEQIELWKSSGISDEDLTLFYELDYRSEQTCDIFVSLYDVLFEVEGELGDRLRTDFLITISTP